MEKKHEIKQLTPALRFPEFKGMKGWEPVQIKNIGNVVTGNTPSKNNKDFWGGNFVWITAQDFNGKYITNSTLKLSEKGKKASKIIPKNSILVTCIASIGLNGISKVECATNQQINSICCYDNYYYEFIYYAIINNIKRLKQLAGQTAVPIITKKIFEEFNINIIKNIDEQKKIAECLSSIDKLIDATTQKVVFLKAHKQGLMQRLFAKVNENIPALRFPEFTGMKGWEPVQIKNIGDVVTGNTPSKNNKDFWGGNFVWITAQDFNGKYISNSTLKLSEKGKKASKIIPKNSILVTCIASIGLNGINKVECATNQQINSICCYKNYNYEYIYYSITNNVNRLKQLAGQTAVPIISKKIFEEFNINIIKDIDEQIKIADCLSSLDNIIETTNRKIEALKKFRIGLMQQLFPKI